MRSHLHSSFLTGLFLFFCSGHLFSQQIVFVKNVANNPEIFSMADVDIPTEIVQLTLNPGIDNHPEFHTMTNGEIKVVWSSDRAPGNNFEIYIGTYPNLDATAVRLTFNNYPDRHPHLSHNGLWIVCTGKYRFEPSVICPKSECSIPVNEPCGWYEGLHIIEIGTGIISEIDFRNMPITGGGVWPNSFATWVGHPSFSPDNSKIIFSAALDEGGTDWEVYTVDWTPPNIVSNLTRITQGTLYPNPVNPIQMSAGAEFVSNGTEIIYSSTRTPLGNSQIFKIPANSVNAPVNPINQLTWHYGNDYVPEELGDGRILLTSDLGPMLCPPPAEGASTDLDLWLINPNGSGRINLTDNNLNDEMLLIGDEVSWFCGIKPNLSECTYYPKTWNVCWWKEFYRMGTDPTYLPTFPKREQYTQAWQYVSYYMNIHDPLYFNNLMQAMSLNWYPCEVSWLDVQSWWVVPSYYPCLWDWQKPANPALELPENGSFPATSFFDVFFEFTDIPGATSYGIEVDDSPSFTSPIVQQQGLLQSNFQQILPPGLWYWRASATNGYATSWSTVNYFHLVLGPPPNLVLQNVTLEPGPATCFNASQTITLAGGGSTFAVMPGAIVNMIAGATILMLPSTRLFLGASALFSIAPTGPFCGSLAPSMVTAGLETQEENPANPEKTLFNIYPNPTTGAFTLELNEELESLNMTVEIRNLIGEPIMNHRFAGERYHDFSLANHPAGVYIIHFSAGYISETAKIIRL